MRGARTRFGRFRLGLLIAVVGGVSLLLVGASGASPTACVFAATAGQTTCTFSYTGAVQSWTVPADVGSATIQAWGGHGGVDAASGGSGGFVSGSIAVAGGSVLDVTVAQDGASFQGGTHAFGGGGASVAGGGGGASAVAVEGGTALLVAAGGGGSGVAGSCPPALVPAGTGGDAGAAGQPGGGCDGAVSGAGGAAGAGPTSAGVDGPPCFCGLAVDPGGGGGGYRGGGAGVNATCADTAFHCQRHSGAGGGGGGTNYAAPSATGTSNGLSDRSYGSNGLVSITYSSISEQLANLLGAATGVGSGNVLAVTLARAQSLLGHGRSGSVCQTLSLFEAEVRMFTPGLVSSSQSASLTTQANNAKATLGC